MTGKQFKALREKLGLSQDQLAQLLGLSSKQAVSNIETEFRNPSRLSMALMQLFVDLPEKKSKELRELLLHYMDREQTSSVKAKR